MNNLILYKNDRNDKKYEGLWTTNQQFGFFAQLVFNLPELKYCTQVHAIVVSLSQFVSNQKERVLLLNATPQHSCHLLTAMNIHVE